MEVNFFAPFLIGLREGLEAALVVGILIAYLKQIGRRDVLPRMWLGIGLAIGLSLGVGAILTYGAYELTFQAQEILGGGLSLLAVAMVTWMIFWMQKTSKNMKKSLEGEIDRALATGTLWSIVVIGFISVGREGIETTLLLWSMVQSVGNTPVSLIGALTGILCAVIAGWAIARGSLRLNLGKFFTWTGGFLVVVAAGVLAYAIMDLQEAAVLPGPWSSFAPVDPETGLVAMGWSAIPFGWAFDVSAVIPPASLLQVILQALIGFMSQMTWLQVIAWALYLLIVGSFFVRSVRAKHPRTAVTPAGTTSDTSLSTQQGAA